MIYDPQNPLTEQELDKLGNEDFDSFLDYLDQKSNYLKQFTKPLDTYHLKKFASLDANDKGEALNDDDLTRLNKLGRKNEEIGFDKEKHHEMIKTKTHILKSNGVKNVKTHRSQWFD